MKELSQDFGRLKVRLSFVCYCVLMEQIKLERKLVFDPIQRLLHWLMAISIIVLGATGFLSEATEEGAARDANWHFHIFFGYILTAAFVARVIWGFVGPSSARFRRFFENIKDLVKPSGEPRREVEAFGYHNHAKVAYILFYIAVAGVVISGLIFAGVEHGAGPFARLLDNTTLGESIEELHEAAAWAIGGFISAHLVGMAVTERRKKAPVAQAMVSGYQYRVSGKEGEYESKAK